MGTQKNANIEIWRGIAVFIVVYFHFSARLEPASLNSSAHPIVLNHIGKLGVYIFFVISGYLIAMSLETSKSLADFYSKRISRIWPLFILANISIFVFLMFVPAPVDNVGPITFNTKSANVFDLIGTSFFLKDLGFRWVDGVYWSILVELKFYFFAGIFAWLFGPRYIRLFAIAAILIWLVDFSVIVYSSEGRLTIAGHGTLRSFTMVYHALFIPHYLPFFALGMLMFRGKLDGLSSALAACCVITGLVAIDEDQIFSLRPNAIFLALLASALAIDTLLLRNRVFLWLGTYSYSLYLFHQMIGLSLISRFVPHMGIDLAIVAALGIICLISYGASQLVEWRFRRPCADLIMMVMRPLGLDKKVVAHPEASKG